jgi:hypothetical protein
LDEETKEDDAKKKDSSNFWKDFFTKPGTNMFDSAPSSSVWLAERNGVKVYVLDPVQDFVCLCTFCLCTMSPNRMADHLRTHKGPAVYGDCVQLTPLLLDERRLTEDSTAVEVEGKEEEFEEDTGSSIAPVTQVVATIKGRKQILSLEERRAANKAEEEEKAEEEQCKPKAAKRGAKKAGGGAKKGVRIVVVRVGEREQEVKWVRIVVVRVGERVREVK